MLNNILLNNSWFHGSKRKSQGKLKTYTEAKEWLKMAE